MLRLGRGFLLVLYTLIIAVPLAVVVFGSVKTQQEMFASPFAPTLSPNFEGYRTVLGSGGLGQAFLNSTVITATSVTLTLIIASLAAFALARVRSWLAAVVYSVLILGMAVPAQANMIPQRVLFEVLNLLDTRIGLVLINIVVTLPVAVFILTAFMRSLPRELFEAAAIDGAGDMRTFAWIVIPLSLPSLAATAIFLFVMHWNDLLYPLLFIQSPDKRTLPLALLGFQGEFLTNYPLLFSGIVVASLPLVVAYIFLQRYFVEGMTAGAGK